MSSNGMSIDDVTPDTSVTGIEKIPVSDAGTAKSVTTTVLKDYVVGAIASITGVSASDISSDSVYILQSGALKPISASILAEAIYAYMFGKTAVANFSLTDVISVRSGSDNKTTTVGALCEYIAGVVDPQFDIDGLSAAGALADANEFAVAQESGGVWSTLKSTLSALKTFVLGGVKDSVTSTAAIGNNDYVLVLTGNPLVLKKVLKSNAGFGGGDVTGPADAVANGIPQWSANNAKSLKKGLALTQAVASTSQSTEIPSASAVYDAISGMVVGPASTTENKIPQWSATTGSLKDGLPIVTEISAESTNAQMPTAKAVEDRVGLINLFLSIEVRQDQQLATVLTSLSENVKMACIYCIGPSSGGLNAYHLCVRTSIANRWGYCTVSTIDIQA